MLSYFLLITIFHACLAQYSIDLSNPFLLTSDSIKIIDVQIDQQNSYLVSFNDGQVRKYVSDFSTYTQLYVPEIVQKFYSKTLELSMNLSGSKNISMISDMTTTLSKNATILRAYTYPQFFDIHVFSFSEPILDYQGLPIQFSTINPLHILVFNSTTKIIYDDIVTTAFDIGSIFGNGSYTTAVVFKEYTISEKTDVVSFTFTYFHTISALGLVQVNIIALFKYDAVQSKFNLQINSNYSIIKGLSEDIQKITIVNNVVMMQSQTFKLLLYVENVSLNERQDPYIQKNQILNFFYAFDTYYLLFTNGLLKVSIDETQGVFVDTTLINTLPNNNYQLVFGTNVDILYIPETNNIYKAKCINQSFYSINKCISYSCIVMNCKSCPFSQKRCETCADGFTKIDQFNCVQSTTKITGMGNNTNGTNDQTSNFSKIANDSNQINTTNAGTPNSTNQTNSSSAGGTNSTNQTNSSSAGGTNSTNQTNSSSAGGTNSTNQTNSSSAGGTNSTNLTNTSTQSNNTTALSNQSIFSNFSIQGQLSTYSNLFPVLVSFSQYFSGMLNGSKNMMSVPSLRSASPTFYFFANFDDLYLYVFHDRLYGDVMTNLFNEVTDIQSKKWSLFSYGSLLQLLGLSNSSFYEQINYQNSYISYNFITPDHPDQGSQAILVNCTNFFLIETPLIILVFILFRVIFRLLFQYPISQLLRKFDIWGCLFVVLFDGNIQQFAFYTTSEWKNTFFFLLGDKFAKIFTIYFGFILVIVSVGGFLMAFAYYGRLNQYLVDNNRNNFLGVFFLLLQYGLRNLIFGILHSILRPLPYLTMIKILLFAELFFTLVFIISFAWNIYKYAKFMWFYIVISFLRILLISTLTIDYENTNQEIIEDTQCTLLVVMLFVYILATLNVIVVAFVQIICRFTKVCKNESIRKPIFNDRNAMSFNIDTECIHEEQLRRKSKKTKMRKKQIINKRNIQTVFIIKHAILKIIQVQKGGIQQTKTKPNF